MEKDFQSFLIDGKSVCDILIGTVDKLQDTLRTHTTKFFEAGFRFIYDGDTWKWMLMYR